MRFIELRKQINWINRTIPSNNQCIPDRNGNVYPNSMLFWSNPVQLTLQMGDVIYGESGQIIGTVLNVNRNGSVSMSVESTFPRLSE